MRLILNFDVFEPVFVRFTGSEVLHLPSEMGFFGGIGRRIAGSCER